MTARHSRRPREGRQWWLHDALRQFVQLGGILTPENQIPVTLFLIDRFERGYTIGRAAEDAVERYHEGDFQRRA